MAMYFRHCEIHSLCFNLDDLD